MYFNVGLTQVYNPGAVRLSRLSAQGPSYDGVCWIQLVPDHHHSRVGDTVCRCSPVLVDILSAS